MPRIADLVEAMRGNPKNMHFGDLVAVVKAMGYTLARTKGSHRAFTAPGRPLIILQDEGGKAKHYQVKQVLAVLDGYGLPEEK